MCDGINIYLICRPMIHSVTFFIAELCVGAMCGNIGTCSHLISPQDKCTRIPFSMSKACNRENLKLPGHHRGCCRKFYSDKNRDTDSNYAVVSFHSCTLMDHVTGAARSS